MTLFIENCEENSIYVLDILPQSKKNPKQSNSQAKHKQTFNKTKQNKT